MKNNDERTEDTEHSELIRSLRAHVHLNDGATDVHVTALVLLAAHVIESQDERIERFQGRPNDGVAEGRRAAVEDAAPVAKSRRSGCPKGGAHDFRDAHGADAATCLKCSAEKKPNGRKRSQTLLVPPRKLLAQAPAVCSVGGEHRPSADLKSPHCVKCGAGVFEVAPSVRASGAK